LRRLPIIDIEPLRRFPYFRRLWLGLAVSQVGSQLALVAVFYQVYLLTGSSLYVGLVSLAQLGPALVGGDLHALWLYVAAPLAGAALGALAYQFVRGEHGRSEELA